MINHREHCSIETVVNLWKWINDILSRVEVLFYTKQAADVVKKWISHPWVPGLIIHLCHCHCSEINVVSLLNLPGMFLISVNQSQLHLNISTWEYSQHNLYSLLLESSWRHKLDKMLTIQDQVCVLIDKNDKKKSTHVKSHLKPFTFLYILEYC